MVTLISQLSFLGGKDNHNQTIAEKFTGGVTRLIPPFQKISFLTDSVLALEWLDQFLSLYRK